MNGALRNGKGFIYINGQKPFSDPQGFDLTGTINVEEWESGEVNSNIAIPRGNTYELTVKLKDWMYADYIAMMTGSAAVAGQALIVRDEEANIPATPFTVTLDNADNVANSEVVVDVLTGLRYVRVAAAPATGEYTIAAAVLTFAAADTLRDILITYTRTNATAGEMIVLDPDAMPARVAFDGYAYLYEQDTDAVSTQMIRVYCKKCMPKGDFKIGYTPNAIGETDITFAVLNESSGDVTMWFTDAVTHTTPV